MFGRAGHCPNGLFQVLKDSLGQTHCPLPRNMGEERGEGEEGGSVAADEGDIQKTDQNLGRTAHPPQDSKIKGYKNFDNSGNKRI